MTRRGPMGDEQGQLFVLDEIAGLSRRYGGRSRRRSLAAMRLDLEDLSDEALRVISHIMEGDLARVEGAVPREPLGGLVDVVRDPPKSPALVPDQPGLRKKLQKPKREKALPLIRLVKARREKGD